MKVPKGMLILIGNRKYKAGAELPANYTLADKKKANKQPEKAVKNEGEK